MPRADLRLAWSLIRTSYEEEVRHSAHGSGVSPGQGTYRTPRHLWTPAKSLRRVSIFECKEGRASTLFIHHQERTGMTNLTAGVANESRREDVAIESLIKEKGLNAPRVTPAQIDALLVGLEVKTNVFAGTTTTVAAAFLPNGFCVATATSACVDPANFDAEIGAKVATDKVLHAAREKLWELEGYCLKKELDRA